MSKMKYVKNYLQKKWLNIPSLMEGDNWTKWSILENLGSL